LRVTNDIPNLVGTQWIPWVQEIVGRQKRRRRRKEEDEEREGA